MSTTSSATATPSWHHLRSLIHELLEDGGDLNGVEKHSETKLIPVNEAVLRRAFRRLLERDAGDARKTTSVGHALEVSIDSSSSIENQILIPESVHYLLFPPQATLVSPPPSWNPLFDPETNLAACSCCGDPEPSLECGSCGSVAFCSERCFSIYGPIHDRTTCARLRKERRTRSSEEEEEEEKNRNEKMNGGDLVGNDGEHGGYESVLDDRVPRFKRATGLLNVGNSCYLNSVAQALFRVAPLTRYVLRDEYKGDDWFGKEGDEAKVIRAWSNLAKSMKFQNERYLLPRNFKRATDTLSRLYSETAQHQDAQEFFLLLLDAMDEEMKALNSGEERRRKSNESATLIERLFSDEIYTVIECEAKGHRSLTRFRESLGGVPLGDKRHPDSTHFVTVVRQPLGLTNNNGKHSAPKTAPPELPQSVLTTVYAVSLKPEERTWGVLRDKISALCRVPSDRLLGTADMGLRPLLDPSLPLTPEMVDEGIVLYELPARDPVLLINCGEKNAILQTPVLLACRDSEDVNEVMEAVKAFVRRALLDFPRDPRRAREERSYDDDDPRLVEAVRCVTVKDDGRLVVGDNVAAYVPNKKPSSNPIIKRIVALRWDRSDILRPHLEAYARQTARVHPSVGRVDSVVSLLEEHYRKEPLDSPYDCEGCGGKVRAWMSYEIRRFPEVLVVFLKQRYLASPDASLRFEVEGMDLSALVRKGGGGGEESRSHVYDLFACVNHFGTLNRGHYNCFAARDMGPEEPARHWDLIDDADVTPVPVERIVSNNAYVLFYRRRRDRVVLLQPV